MLYAAPGLAQTPKPFTKAQYEQLQQLEDTLGMLAFVIINDSLEENRFGATRLMIPTLVKALKVPNSFKYPFSQLQSVSIQYAPDSTFRIFTWQLFVNDNDYRYYGAIQMNAPELKLFPLIDRSFQIDNVEQAVLNPDNWYGQVYYNIRKLDTPAGPQYLLFGFDAFSFFRKRKLLDAMYFADGKPVFGAPVFPAIQEGAPPRNRMMLEYSAETSIRFNYDAAMDLIVFDHLVAMKGRNGEGEVMVPDGSYEAFRIEKNKLVYIPMLDIVPLDEPPRPAPLPDPKGKDIMGRPTTKKNGN